MDHIFENMYANRELHSVLFEKYDLTLSEMLVLLFLDKNRNSDTATDMVDKLKLAKSHVSASVRDLEARGYIKGNYGEKDRRTIHLRLCDKSVEVIRSGGVPLRPVPRFLGAGAGHAEGLYAKNDRECERVFM